MMPTLMDELETSTTTTSPDPMAALIRGLRARRGLSLQGLGRAVGASAPHLFNIETGRKLPGESLAARIAVELGIEPEVFRAWVRVAGRSDWRVARQAVMRLESFFHDPETAELMSASGIDTGPLRTDPSRIEIAVARRASDRAPAWPGMQPPRQVATASAGPARVLIPVFEPGRDPVTQDSARGRGPALRLDPAHFQG